MTLSETEAIYSELCDCKTDKSDSQELDDALTCAKLLLNSSSVELKLQLEELSLNRNHAFEGGTNIQITGMPTSIKCNSSSSSGLRFINSTNITFTNITLNGCGSPFISRSHNFINHSLPVMSLTAIYFEHCYDMMFTNVSITNSEGIGLTMVNCRGVINITGSNFINNSITKDSQVPGGGGISIEILGERSQSKRNSSTVHNQYYISNCNFYGNTASSGKFLITHITENKDNYFMYGQGGGLSVNFKNTTNRNYYVVIENSHFKLNTAQRGGALFVAFRDDTDGNTVIVNNTLFKRNSCVKARLPPGANFSSGGAIKVIFYTNTKGNNFFINSSRFENNSAYFGGALSMGTGTNYYSTDAMCQFTIWNCTFYNNNARIGAAIDFYARISVTETNHGSSVIPYIYDSNFTNNGGLYQYSSGATGRTFATIYIVYIQSKFFGAINIINNTASGFGIEEATVHFENYSLVKLTKNIAKIGGGVAMIGRSTILLYENTTIIFHSNTATEKGGAIFSTQSQERYSAYELTCFIQYFEYEVKPFNWNVSLQFSNNTAGDTKMYNDIYASSLLPCVWPSNATSKLKNDITDTFCGWSNSWHVDTPNRTCKDLIKTSPSRFKNTNYSVSVIPGDPTNIIDFGVLDDLDHDVSELTLYTVSKINPKAGGLEITVTNDTILLKIPYLNGCPKNFTIVLQTADRKSVSTQINVTVYPCPPGYSLQRMVCECNKSFSFEHKIQCSKRQAVQSFIFAGHCITYSLVRLPNNVKNYTLIVARCPYVVVSNFTTLYIPVPQPQQGMQSPQQGDIFCKSLHRAGRLCGDCLPGYGLDFYSINFMCINCNITRVKLILNWVKVIAASILPTTILFVLCTVFHISITSARFNGYIFFSHVVTMRLDVLTVQYASRNLGYQADQLSRLLYTPYYMWTFNFPQIILREICLGEKYKVIHALALQYLSVLYPLLLVFMAIILIELHARNCKPLVWLWKPLCYVCVRFRHSWEIRTSVIDTFASFLLLSYSNLIGVSMSLITPTNIIINNGTVVGRTLNYDTSVDFFEKTHLKFGVFAIIILCTIGAIPPILLILYPFKWFQNLLNKCNLRGPRRFLQVFVDAFQGSYKNNVKGYPERRYFAGVYFVFRITINIIYVAIEDMIVLHLTLTLVYMLFMLIILAYRPYKRNYYNIIDGIFMAILLTTHALYVYLFYYAITLLDVPKTSFFLAYTIQYIPTLYMILLVIYLISTRLRCIKRLLSKRFGRKILFFKNEGFNDKNSPYSPLENCDWPSSSSLTLPSPSSPLTPTRQLSDTPDRVENPHRYEPMLDSWQFSGRGGSTRDFNPGELKKKDSTYGLDY